MRKIHEIGRSMVEMLGVLAIIGVLSIGAIAGYAHAMNKQKMNKTIDQMAQIINNIRTAYQNDKQYQQLDNILGIKLGVFPTEMIVDANTGSVQNLYKGEVILSGTTENFEVTFQNLPQDVATQLGMTDWGTNDDDLQQVKLKTEE